MMEIDGLSGLEGTDLIQKTFLFQLLNFDETLALANLFQRESAKKGESIIEENALGQALYLIQSGRVGVFKGEGSAREEIAALGAGELFGEMSLIENELTSASVVALEPTVLLVIRRKDFEELLAGNKDIALKVFRTFCNTLSERLRRTSRELSHLKSCLSDEEEAEIKARRPAKKPAAASKKSPAKGKSRK